MSFLRLRHPQLEPDEGNMNNNINRFSQNTTSSSQSPTSSKGPSSMLLPRMMNRSKSAGDPPGSYPLTNRNSMTTYDTTDEKDDESSWSSSNNNNGVGIKHVTSSDDDDHADRSERRNDPPILKHFTTYPLDAANSSSVASKSFASYSGATVSTATTTGISTTSLLEDDAPSVESQYFHQQFLQQQKRDDKSSSNTSLVHLQSIPEIRSHTKFNKDLNLVSSSTSKNSIVPQHLISNTRSPEVTLIADTVMTTSTTTSSSAMYAKEDPSEHFQLDTSISTATQIHEVPMQQLQPSSARDPESAVLVTAEASPYSIHKSVKFDVVHIYEHFILDTSVESFYGGEGNETIDYSITAEQIDEHPKSLDPPTTLAETSILFENNSSIAIVSTVDEYEAQRQPKRRQLKDVEGMNTSTTKTLNRSDQLRRILSNGTVIAGKNTSFLRHHGNATAGDRVNSSSSEYVSVQELVPPSKAQQWNLKFGSKRQQQEPSTTNIQQERTTPQDQQSQGQAGTAQSDDIFEAYQLSFIGDEQQGQQQANGHHHSSNRQVQVQLPKPSLLLQSSRRARSLSSISVSSNSSRNTGNEQQRRGVFGRLFSSSNKKDMYLRTEI